MPYEPKRPHLLQIIGYPLLLVFGIAFCVTVVFGQAGQATRTAKSDPTGVACTSNSPILEYNNGQYTCVSSAYALTSVKRAEYATASLPTCNAAYKGQTVNVTDRNQGSRTCRAIGTSVYAWVDDTNATVSPRIFGAIADGTSHPLSERYASLAAAQADFSFVSALTQQIDWAAIQAATNLAGTTGFSGGVKVELGAGNYYLGGDTVTVDAARTHIEGNGKYATIITFAPSSAATAFKFTNGASVLYQCSIRGMGFQATGSAQKTAIELIDTGETYIEDIAIFSTWTGSNSIGIFLKGRELTTIKRVDVTADQPIKMGDNPNSSIDHDHLLMENLYLITLTSTNAAILVEGSNLWITNWKIQGVNAFALGKYGIYYADGGGAIPASLNWEWEGIRCEQFADATGYNFYVTGSVYSLLVKNCKLDSAGNGIYYRGVVYATIQNTTYDSNSKESLNIDSTVYPLTLLNFFTQVGSTVTMTGHSNVWKQDVYGTSTSLPANGLWMPTSYANFNAPTGINSGAITATAASTFKAPISSEYSLPLALANDGTGSGTYRNVGVILRDNISGPTFLGAILGRRNNAAANWYTEMALAVRLANSPTTSISGLQEFLVLNGQSVTLSVGANGATNPQFQVDAATASVATGVKITGAAAGNGVTVAAISSGTNENLILTGKGTGGVAVGASGAAISTILSGTASLDFAQALATTCEELTITVTGAADGNPVQIGIPNALVNHNLTATFTAWISAADTVKVRRCVISADGSDPAAATVRATVTKH